MHPKQWIRIDMKGKDARDFLQRLSSADIAGLNGGMGTPGLFLNSKGQLMTLFQVWCISHDHFVFELNPGSNGQWKSNFLEFIEHYTFAEEFTVELSQDMECRWVFDPQNAPHLPANTLETLGSVTLFDHGSEDYGHRWITLWGPSPKNNGPSPLDEHVLRLKGIDPSPETLTRWRVENLQADVDQEIEPGSHPLDLGLQRAIADKGCFPGQEVIQKVLSRGSPAHRLIQIEGAGPPPQKGTPLQDQEKGNPVGHVTSASVTERGFLALGVVRKTHAKDDVLLNLGNNGQTGKVVRIAPYEA